MMTNNGGFQSDYSSGQGDIYNRANTYQPNSPSNYPPQYPPQQQPNYPPQQYPPQQPQNYGRANTYMPQPPNPYQNQPNNPPNPYQNQPYNPPNPYQNQPNIPPNPYMNQPNIPPNPQYGHSNTYVPPPSPYPNYPPQQPAYPPYGHANTFIPPPVKIPEPIISAPTTPIISAPTVPVPLPTGFAPYPTNFNTDMDCQILHNAVHGAGTDERSIINIICNRNGLQRAEIRRRYKALYGKDLIKRLKEDTSGNFKDVVAGMFMTPSEYDATCLYKAMKGLGTNEGVLIEIIGTRSPQQLMTLKAAFTEIYKKDLEAWVKSETSGNFRKLLVALLQCNRSMNPTPDPVMCQSEAQMLYAAGEGRLGTDESTFIRIFANKSAAEIMMINDCYSRLRGNGLLHAIDKEFSGDIKKLLKTVVEGLLNLPAYFAKRIREAVEGLGTNDSKLVRVIVSRSEIDLGLIKQAYRERYGRDMLYDVRDDTSGYYKEILTGLIARC